MRFFCGIRLSWSMNKYLCPFLEKSIAFECILANLRHYAESAPPGKVSAKII